MDVSNLDVQMLNLAVPPMHLGEKIIHPTQIPWKIPPPLPKKIDSEQAFHVF